MTLGRVWRGTGLQLLGRLVSGLASAAALVLVARGLPAEELGRLAFYLAAFLLLECLADFGTGTLAVQRTAAAPERLAAVLAPARRVRAILAGAGALLVGAGAWLLGEPGAGWIAAAALYPLARSLELSGVSFVNEISWGTPVLVRSLSALGRLGLFAALLAAGVRSAGPYLAAHAAATAAGHVALHLAARGRLPRDRTSPIPARSIFVAALPLGLAGLCQQAYVHVDHLFVRALLGAEEVGVYHACARIASLLTLGAVYATTASLPWLARAHAAGTLAPALARLARPLLVSAFALAALAWPLADEVLLLLFGPGFEAGAPALRWLLASAVLVQGSAVLLTSVVAAGATRAFLRIAAGALLLNVAGNAWLVPLFGIEGAAIATLATEGAVALLAGAALARAARPLPAGT